MITQGMIDHVKEHQFAFDELMKGPRDVSEYFATYSYVPDIYERVCAALGVEPRAKAMKS